MPWWWYLVNFCAGGFMGLALFVVGDRIWRWFEHKRGPRP